MDASYILSIIQMFMLLLARKIVSFEGLYLSAPFIILSAVE